MDAQFLLTAAAFGVTLVMAGLTAIGVLGSPTAFIDGWIARRPTIPRRWLVVAFWCNLVLPVAALGIYAGTSGRYLSTEWNDAAQFLLWLSMTVDAAVMRQRLWLAVTLIFFAFSAYEVVTHL